MLEHHSRVPGGLDLGQLCLLRRELIPLQAAHDGDKALIDEDEFTVRQRSAIVGANVLEDHVFAVGFVDRHIGGFLQLADGASGLGALVQQLDDLQVERIDLPAPVTDVHSLASSVEVVGFLPGCRSLAVLRMTVRLLDRGHWPQPFNKLCHCRRRIVRRRLFDQPNDRAADDGRISKFAESGDVGRIRNSKTECDGQLRIPAQAFDERPCVPGERLLSAGDAGAGDGVDKALAHGGDAAQSIVRAGRRGKKNGRKGGRAQGIEIAALRLFNGEIGGEDAIDACRLRFFRESFEPVAENRIEIRKNNQAGLGAGCTQLLREREDVRECGAVGDRTMAGSLDDRSIGKRIAEGDAKLKHVGTRVNRRERDSARGGEIGIADGKVDNEAGAPREVNRHECPFYVRKEASVPREVCAVPRGSTVKTTGARHSPKSRGSLARAIAYVLLAAIPFAAARDIAAYSVLTHQAIIDLSWNTVIQPLLLSRYPRTTKADLQTAHAYAYGGCAIQDAGYYPFSRQFFSDLTHYVRTGDFVESLLRNAGNVNEYAFALGALSHYVGDSVGHADAINHATAIEYPKLAKKYGSIVTYEDAPRQYVATEFSFDVDTLSRRRFAPASYQRRVGLLVPRRLLEQAFFETYGLTFTGVMGKTGRASIRSYRTSIRNFIPGFAKAEVVIHRSNFPKGDPESFRTIQPCLQDVPYLPAWATAYRDPSIVQHVLAGVIWILPPIGVVRILKIRGPRTETEELYYASLDRTLTLYERRLNELRLLPGMPLGLPNRDLDTGEWTKPGVYRLTDQTYARLLREITEEQQNPVPPGLKQDILSYYAVPDAPITTKRNPDEWTRVQKDLARLRATQPRPALANDGVE